MKQTSLAMATDWCTMAYAAERIGVSLREVSRMVADKRLNGQRPRVGASESARFKIMLRVDEVEEYARARALVRRSPR